MSSEVKIVILALLIKQDKRDIILHRHEVISSKDPIHSQQRIEVTWGPINIQLHRADTFQLIKENSTKKKKNSLWKIGNFQSSKLLVAHASALVELLNCSYFLSNFFLTTS